MKARQRALQIAVAVAIAAGQVHAEPLLSGQLAQDAIAIDVGVIAHVGQSEYAFRNGGTDPSVQGLVIRDRNGYTGRAVVALVLALLGGVGATGEQHFDHTYVQVEHTRPDYDTVTTTTVTHTIHLPSRAELDGATSDSIAGLFNLRHSEFEFDLYSRNWLGVGDSDGYKLTALVGAGETTAVQLGFGFGTVRSYVKDDAGMPARINYSYIGIPIRVSRVFGPVRLAATWEWNILKSIGNGGSDRFSPDKFGMSEAHTASSPFHLDASTVVLGRILVGAGITAQRFYHPGTLGATVSVGVEF